MDFAPRQVAVLRFSCAGDVLLTLPAFDALRAAWPSARLVAVTRPIYAPLLRGQPAVDAVIELPRGRSLLRLHGVLRQLQTEQPGELAVLDLHGRLYSRLLRPAFWRSRWACWHKRSLRRSAAFLLGDGRAHAPTHLVGRYHAAAEALVGEALPRQPLRYVVPQAAGVAALVSLRAAGFDPDRPILALSPGAMWATKRWPVERFAAVAVAAQARGLQVVLTGSAAETDLHRALLRLAPQARSLAGQGDLAQLAGVLRQCCCLVVGDSGPMHLARAVGTPVVALFGCTDPQQFDFHGHTVVRAQAVPDCAPCTFHGREACPRGHFSCLLGVEVASVLDAVYRVASRGGRILG